MFYGRDRITTFTVVIKSSYVAFEFYLYYREHCTGHYVGLQEEDAR